MSIEIVSMNANIKKGAVRRWPINDKTVFADTLGLRPNRRTLARNADIAQTHGQTARCIYVYPILHYEFWMRQLNMELMPGAFGEHLTVSGVDELKVGVGDHWTWGNAVFMVSSHGAPNQMLNRFYEADITGEMQELGFCGWHLKTVTPGVIPTRGRIQSFPSSESRMSVLESLRAAQREEAQLPAV